MRNVQRSWIPADPASHIPSPLSNYNYTNLAEDVPAYTRSSFSECISPLKKKKGSYLHC